MFARGFVEVGGVKRKHRVNRAPESSGVLLPAVITYEEPGGERDDDFICISTLAAPQLRPHTVTFTAPEKGSTKLTQELWVMVVKWYVTPNTEDSTMEETPIVLRCTAPPKPARPEACSGAGLHAKRVSPSI
jgi:hypothetical protein